MSTEDEQDEILPKENEELKTKKCSYQTMKLLGKGGYGAVFEVIRKTDKQHFAIKCEKISARKKVLAMDCKVLQGAREIKSRHFCTIEDRGKVDNRFVFLVMKLIGRNLWDLRVDRESMRFTIGTALKAANQCLICIEELHRIGFLHRDIKPGNFAVGQKESNDHHCVYMLDFGLCRKFMVAKDKDVRCPRDIAPFRGTTRYAPLSAMRQVDQSRKDDLEGWLYMVAEWTSGGLPWRRFKADNREEVMKMKEELRSDPAALDRFLLHCPKREFTRIMKYIDELNYFSIPDYKFIHECVKHALKANNVKVTDPLDWDEKNEYMLPLEEPGNGKPVESDQEDKKDDNLENIENESKKTVMKKLK